VPVSTGEELLNLLSEGWRLYFHKVVRRWYVYRGARDRMIVSAKLEDLCNKIYKKLRGESEPVPALDIQESRLQGQPIEDIASDVGLSRVAVYNALDKKPDDVTKPRERSQLAVPETVLEERDVGVNVDEESQSSNPLGPLIVGGILVGIPLSIFALWFFGNLTTGKLKV